MTMKHRVPLIAGLVVLAAAQGGLIRASFPFWEKNYAPNKNANLQGLTGDQLFFALAGFREMVAGILWVRADTFFDEGNYDAILPIIRLVTMLDPKQIDVYATGMWHIAYNFTDEQSRSDRRYIPSAIALGKEGAKNNDYTYELFFETGWLWYHKIDDDYGQAVKWWEDAATKEDMQVARRNILAMAYMRDGKLMEALNHYASLLEEAEEKFEASDDFANRQNRDTIEGNLDNMIVRMAQRGSFAQMRGDYGQSSSYDTQPPFDVDFSARVTVEEPMVLRIQGTWGVQPVGTRVRFVLKDKNYPGDVPGGMEWDSKDTVDLDPPAGVTFCQDQLFVRNQVFDREVDMSRDPTMYPFLAEEYVLEFYYNPRSAPPHIQDRFGFNGEGMTDSNFLRTDIRNGQRVMYTTLTLTRDQIMRLGEWSVGSGQTPTVQTKNFVSVNRRVTDDVLQVPGLRNTAPAQPSQTPQQVPRNMPARPGGDPIRPAPTE